MIFYKHIRLFIFAFIIKYNVANNCSTIFDPTKVTLRLYNKVYPAGTTALTLANFVPNSDVKVVIHGWSEDGTNLWISELTAAYINRLPDINVVVVDYGTYSQRDYLTAYCVSDAIGNFVGQRLKAVGIAGGLLTCTGFSLGAHICGYASRYYGVNGEVRWQLIIGMDAAAPGFHTFPNPLETRQALSQGDARVVIAYYTNGCIDGFGTDPSEQYADHNVIVKDGCCQDGCMPCSMPILLYFPWTLTEMKQAFFCSHILAREIEIKQQSSNAYNVVPCDTVENCKASIGSGVAVSLSYLWTSSPQNVPKNYFLLPNTT